MNKLNFLVGILTFSALSLGLFSCQTDGFVEDDLSYSQDLIEFRADPRKTGKDAVCCIVNNKAGIACFESVGNSCTTIHACEAVSSSVMNGQNYFTPSELDNWMTTNFRSNRPFMIHMWEIGKFIHPDSIK